MNALVHGLHTAHSRAQVKRINAYLRESRQALMGKVRYKKSPSCD